MSKKRRARKSSARRRQQAQATRRPSARQKQETPAFTEVDFKTEYHYVLNDLRRFAYLAVAMFATLIVLALVIR